MEWSEGEKKRLGFISNSFHGAEHTMAYIDSQITNLPSKLESLRNHGYLFFADLEEKLQQAAAEWQKVRPHCQDATEHFKSAYHPVMDAIGGFGSMLLMSGLLGGMMGGLGGGFGGGFGGRPGGGRGYYGRQRSGMGDNLLLGAGMMGVSSLVSMESDVTHINQVINTLAQPVHDKVASLEARISEIDFSLHALQTATFSLKPGEELVLTGRGKTLMEDKSREIFFFLTSERLILEKVENLLENVRCLLHGIRHHSAREFFIDAEMKTIADAGLETGIHQQVITLQFTPDAEIQGLQIDTKDADTWVALIKDVLSGEILANAVKGVPRQGKPIDRSAFLKAKADKVQAMLDQLDESLLNGKISEETYKELKGKYQERIEQIKVD
jgi:hypothetical protein